MFFRFSPSYTATHVGFAVCTCVVGVACGLSPSCLSMLILYRVIVCLTNFSQRWFCLKLTLRVTVLLILPQESIEVSIYFKELFVSPIPTRKHPVPVTSPLFLCLDFSNDKLLKSTKINMLIIRLFEIIDRVPDV